MDAATTGYEPNWSVVLTENGACFYRKNLTSEQAAKFVASMPMERRDELARGFRRVLNGAYDDPATQREILAAGSMREFDAFRSWLDLEIEITGIRLPNWTVLTELFEAWARVEALSENDTQMVRWHVFLGKREL